MDEGRTLADLLRGLDPGSGTVPVRAQALTGLVEGLRVLLGSGATVVERHDGAEGAARIVLGAGPTGAVACVATAGTGTVEVAHSVDPGVVRALADRLDPSLPVPHTAAPRHLALAVESLLRGLDAAVAATRRQAADRLHDGLLQELTVAQLLIEATIVKDGAPGNAGMLQRGVDTLRTAIASTRQLMTELLEQDRPPEPPDAPRDRADRDP